MNISQFQGEYWREVEFRHTAVFYLLHRTQRKLNNIEIQARGQGGAKGGEILPLKNFRWEMTRSMLSLILAGKVNLPLC